MENKKKLIILSSIIVGGLIVVLGFTYALFTFDRSGVNQELVLGDIWMKYTESNGISLENALPGAEYSKYFEFTITGKNTYTEKDIWYDIRLTKGDVPEGKTEDNRIEDKYLKFKLVEINGEVETEIFTDKTYDNLSNQTIHVATIPKDTNEYSKTYRLYMVISEELKVGNVEGAISSSEFETLFGSIKVATTGDFTEKEGPHEPINWFDEIVLSKHSETNPTYIREDGITYLSGSQEDIDFNYVWYSGKLWRITAIYPDGTMKMITEDLITTIDYNESGGLIFYESEENNSWAYQWLNQDFLSTLYNYENIIVVDALWKQYNKDNDELFSQTSASVGLFNVFEYQNSIQEGDTYLHNGYYWFLLDVLYDGSYFRDLYEVSGAYGSPINSTENYSRGIRPVIILKSTIEFINGDGSRENPYRIKGDKEDINENITLLNMRSSGEYVSFNNELFRVIENEMVNNQITTKLIKVDYLKDSEGNILNKKLASSNIYGSSTNTQNDDYWDYYLNNTWLKEFDSTFDDTNRTSSILVEGNYYLGEVEEYDTYYKTSVCQTSSNTISINVCEKTANMWTGYVGVSRYGEMFSSQIGKYLDTYTTDIWLITPTLERSLTYNKYIGNKNYGSYSYRETDTKSIRPIISLNSSVVIKSGTGLPNDPFVVGLPS